ncbi:SixA phosphatase family protein [Planctobacterium marinum]|uniref:Histidine phosphatase family protein n=1 Tax=Planctobacterium marinum TaxID=1631968 RepID=A0AA48KTH1_9ALTE|nr:hypothetical protein MACH26_36980 [Planctobacterium marinum]
MTPYSQYITLLFSTVLISLLLAQPVTARYEHIRDADVYLVRHMEKQRNGSKDPQLTEKGWVQAKKLRDALKDRGIQVIYSSDYQRTQQTAEPLATALGLTVKLYDPKNLAPLAESIQASGLKTLVVGHSNTTPELAWRLTGQPQPDIDEGEYNWTLYAINKGSFSLGPVDQHVEWKKPELAKIEVNKERLHSFESQFNMLFSGQKTGTATQTVKVQDNQILLTEVTRNKKFNVDATIKAVAKKEDLLPIAMRLTGSMGRAADINMEWREEGPNNNFRAIYGYSDIPRAVYKRQGRQSIENTLGLTSIERTTAIMTVPFWDNDKAFTFKWYDTYQFAERKIQYIPLGKENVTVPAGSFDTYKVKLSGGAPSQIFYISNEDKPKVVKIEVLHMPWVYELAQYKTL